MAKSAIPARRDEDELSRKLSAGDSLHVAESTYGSDKAGLVWSYLFTPGHAGHPVNSDDVANRLATRPSGEANEFLWLHFNLANAASEHWLRQRLSLPDALS
jgi:zinc transporter